MIKTIYYFFFPCWRMKYYGWCSHRDLGNGHKECGKEWSRG